MVSLAKNIPFPYSFMTNICQLAATLHSRDGCISGLFFYKVCEVIYRHLGWNVLYKYKTTISKERVIMDPITSAW